MHQRAVNISEQAGGLAEEKFACRRETHLAGGALEKRNAKAFFNALHLAGDGTLGQAGELSRPGEAAVLYHELEKGELIKIERMGLKEPMHFLYQLIRFMNLTRENARIILGGMAEQKDRLKENVPGAFYVDSSCVDCDICRNEAPLFFKRDDEIGLSIVYRQPISPDEIALAEEAMDGCPTSSIGKEK